MLAVPAGEEKNILQPTRSLGSSYIKNAFAAEPCLQTHFLAYLEPMNVSGGCKCRPISVKRNVTTEPNVVVSECAVR